MTNYAVLIGALDTKGIEFRFVKEGLERLGIPTLIIDVGVLDTPLFEPDIRAEEVAVAAGTTLEQLRQINDRGKAVTAMAEGAFQILKRLVSERRVGGVFGMGGTAGTTVGAAAMKAVPIGIPKLLVSTVASGNTRPYVGVKDVTMMYSVVDIAGINKLSRRILSNAVYALAGMVKEIQAESSIQEERVTLGMTMFGVTTPCVTRVREILETRGYDLLVFHATGAGGMAMEELIDAGYIKGVLDITTTELADELVGGIFSAGPHRLEAGARADIPQVVSVGAMDMVNFGQTETIPAQFKDRQFYQHNPTTTLMRTTEEENRRLGTILAEKLNQASNKTVVIFPKGGVSLLDLPSKAFHGPEQREALYSSLKSTLKPEIPFIETDFDINDPSVATLIATTMIRLMEGNSNE
ncbi:Tm-1-like ATP-binding domain-containing protein [Paenibacillus roseipurpureus]|uniref:Tm-1-like ATP-binding domain-containing protein n=1 Tax=Paenibacillus roseopurpureus TaxID=2918901 RepID=A0AA96LT49_9BACL|nr:Tm-1-like ATP-binding domain-containing protein [Paenibacillus sp. MBLB1832]WNR46046.1 Tm-1-like ATP-binding domain-containing protein [Paenibacillus sp. MBLB1832]